MDPSRPSRTPQPQAAPFVAGAANRPQRSVPPISLPSHPSTSSFGSAVPDKPTPSSVNDSPSTNPLVRDATRVQFNVQDTPLSSMPPGEPFRRKKSLVRPERAPNDPSHPLYNYRTHAARLEADGHGYVGASTTGAHPSNVYDSNPHPNLRRGKSILARDEGLGNDSALNFLKRGATLRRNRPAAAKPTPKTPSKPPVGIWMIYCYIITCCCPSPMLRCFGLTTYDRQRAWREKIGLLGVICILMAAVGFLTFGFTQAVCGTPPTNFSWDSIDAGSMVYHGYDYSMDTFAHPAANGVEAGSNPLYSDWNAGAQDGSFLFQNTDKCKSIITPASGTGIPTTNGDLNWYFPCNFHSTDGSGSKNITGYTQGTLCHNIISTAVSEFDTASAGTTTIGMKREGPVTYTWDQVANTSRNLGVYETSVLDFDLLSWLDTSQVSYPDIFTQLMNKNSTWQGRDATMQIVRNNQRDIAECLADVIRVGFVEGDTIGCIISDIVLYVSLVFIVGIVAIRFALAVVFTWVYSWRLGSFGNDESSESRRKRAAEIEAWSEDIYRPAPARYRPTTYNAPGKKSKLGLPNKSRFTYTPQKSVTALASANNAAARPVSYLGGERKAGGAHARSATAGSIGLKTSRSQSSLQAPTFSLGGDHGSQRSSMSFDSGNMASSVYSSGCPYPLANVVPQPPPTYEPFNFPLAHTILLVTAYSESIEGLRTTLDSLATTDYPNSHKLILVIADGMVKGSGNELTTPEIVLSMMKEDLVPRDEVEANSYVAIADGHKKHNMAKVYAGFYDYDNETIEKSRQQRVPMILVEKTGNPLEAHDAKPGNRGKRDSQVLLMSFLQKVMFDERMTLFEFNFFNAIWRITGISADRYETVLMIDADTKAFPDSVSRMMACMQRDPEIMGLCGETKIANKSETWVTMIQVFEYFVSHHQTKAFESMFGGVSCLPGCFSMYRIKAPKGDDGYWVPILANPDIVEHYSECVVDTLHKKNLLLLGEDRFLTTLMLRTFPRRKMMFCPQAVCKTMVPDTLKVLLSQRRRWINSTIHNLFELLLVRGLCGTFCFSMQFILFVELIGTLVLPAAISFTLYIIIIAIIPSQATPTVSLILLAFVLGLPGLLIVITARHIIYVLWMIIYLLSLPIWNAILPTYAYFHMDDFSWGATRKVEGDKGGGHDDKSGEFDSNNIVMKRWAEFERERRWKSGTHSRESVYYGGSSDVFVRTDSPRPTELRRSSINSTSESTIQDPFINNGSSTSHYVPVASDNASNLGTHRRAETLPLLELPAPLSRTSHTSSTPQSPNNFSSAEGSPVDVTRWQSQQQYSTSGSDIGYAYSTVPKDESQTAAVLGHYTGNTGYQPQSQYSPQEVPQALSSSDYMRYQPVDNEVDDVELEPSREGWNGGTSVDHHFADTTEEEVSLSSRDHRNKAIRSRDPSVGASISSRYGGVSLVDDGPATGSSNVKRRSRKSSTGFGGSQNQQQRNSKLLERTRSIDTEESNTQHSDINLSDSGINPYFEGGLPPGARR